MARKTKMVGDYEVHELSVKVMMPIIKVIQEDDSAGQLELIGASVHENGQPIGVEGAEDLGMSDFTKLAAAVVEINGLDVEGND